MIKYDWLTWQTLWYMAQTKEKKEEWERNCVYMCQIENESK